MNSMHDNSIASDIDESASSYRLSATSTPNGTYKPRVNFHSIESLATSSLTSLCSPSVSYGKYDDTGYRSFNSPIQPSREYSFSNTSDRRPRRKLSDWQIWYLNEVYARNRYPSPSEQAQIADELLLPPSSIRIWFQNHRARFGKK